MTSRANLRPAQTVLLGSLMFGLFFGAGNLIFPMSLGLQAGTSVFPAVSGFLIAAVGLPIIGVVASALSGTSSLHELAERVSPRFATVFTCALYLTIGPFFAIPRTATVSYEMSFGGWFDGAPGRLALFGFSALFFAVVLIAAWRPGRMLDYVGKFLTPVFLVLLGVLLTAAFLRGSAGTSEPAGPYALRPLGQGVLDGYNTMDALASLAFAIIIIEAARSLGATTRASIAREVAKSGVFAAIAMAVIYVALALVGSRSSELVGQEANGAVAIAAVAQDLFGSVGHVLAAAIMLVACLKTAIGLIAACSEMFATMFPSFLGQKGWAIVFTVVSLAMANFGLETIIEAAVPVLQLLYPMAIVMILLGLLDRWVSGNRVAHWLPMVVAGAISLLEVLAGLGELVPSLSRAAAKVGAPLPGFESGFGWVLPTLVALGIGLLFAGGSTNGKVLRPEEERRTSE